MKSVEDYCVEFNILPTDDIVLALQKCQNDAVEEIDRQYSEAASGLKRLKAVLPESEEAFDHSMSVNKDGMYPPSTRVYSGQDMVGDSSDEDGEPNGDER